ncbi:hypothetical protein T05_2290 [Trichinella murrelli]|uniref:Uncharacterized protein n=1 Tax=Trichinella murrelli TaxID=144512 RepID=A0A0V0TJC7_9BILA|nr:hypothetical protein T05_2290 [Trichinella murrelli]
MLKRFKDEVRFDGERYVVKLPKNYVEAEQRLQQFEMKLRRVWKKDALKKRRRWMVYQEKHGIYHTTPSIVTTKRQRDADCIGIQTDISKMFLQIRQDTEDNDISCHEFPMIGMQRFQDEFDTSIHTNKSLSTIEKFSYLRSLLIENAVAEIEGLPLNNTLNSFPTVTNQWGYNRLRQLANQLEVHFRGLETLQTPAERHEALMLMILPRMLRELTLEWKQGRTDEKKSREFTQRSKCHWWKRRYTPGKNTPRLHYMLRSNRHAYCANGIIKFGTVPIMSAHEKQLIAPRRGLYGKIQVGWTLTSGIRAALLQIAHARLHGPSGNNMIVGCLLDSDFYRLFVKTSVADALNLESSMETIFVESFCRNWKKYKKAQRVKLWVSSLDGKGEEKQLV